MARASRRQQPGVENDPAAAADILRRLSPSMGYGFALAPNTTIQFEVESETGENAVMDYWSVAFKGSWSGPNLCVLDNKSTMRMPQFALKVGNTTSFEIRPGDTPGTYQIATFTNYGGGQQSGIAIVKPVTPHGWEPLPTIRWNAANFTSGFRQGYVEAMKALKQAPSRLLPPTNSRYDDYVLVHMLAMKVVTVRDKTKTIQNGNIDVGGDRVPMWAHQGPLFLPWHRVFLREFELDFQQEWGGFLGIPYWDWSVNASTKGVPWTDDFMGSGLPDGPVLTGPFAGAGNWKVTLSENTSGPNYLMRGLGQGKTKSLPTLVDVIKTLSAMPYDAPDWDSSNSLTSFRNALEGWYSASGSELPAMPLWLLWKSRFSNQAEGLRRRG